MLEVVLVWSSALTASSILASLVFCGGFLYVFFCVGFLLFAERRHNAQ